MRRPPVLRIVGAGTRWIDVRKPGVVKSSFPITGSDDRVVLLFWGLSEERRLRNVVRLDRDGLVKWRAELPGEAERDCFVRLERRGDAFVARTYAGHEVRFDNDGAAQLQALPA